MPRTGAARVLVFAFLGEGALGLAALLWVLLRRLPVTWGEPGRAIATGIAVAVLLAAVQYGLLHHAPAIGPVEALRRLYGELLYPLFHSVTPAEIIGISVLAGVGEELFFRGAMQQEWGWAAASLIFGLCHVGNRDTLILGLWAALVGGILGWLAMVTGGLLAPIIAHALYDALALSYIRWGFVPEVDRDVHDGDGNSGGRTSL
jgi:membrane protease YdiL (CAAX protease family)